jgi:hypothetical protein
MLLVGCARGRWNVAPEDRDQAGARVRSNGSRRTMPPLPPSEATRTAS